MTKNGPASDAARVIDDSLKRAYRDAAQEAVPDRFLNLLAKLKAAELAHAKGAKDEQ